MLLCLAHIHTAHTCTNTHQILVKQGKQNEKYLKHIPALKMLLIRLTASKRQARSALLASFLPCHHLTNANKHTQSPFADDSKSRTLFFFFSFFLFPLIFLPIFSFFFFFFYSSTLSILHSLSPNLHSIYWNLYYFRDQPFLFCMLRFSMAIFLSIREQQKLTRSLPPSSRCCTAEQPNLRTPVLPCSTHTLHAPSSLTVPSASPASKKSRSTTYGSDQRMSSTSADFLPAQSYKTATKQQNISHSSQWVLDPILLLNSVALSRQKSSREKSMSREHARTDARSNPEKIIQMSRSGII